jgi:hypothetical protein
LILTGASAIAAPPYLVDASTLGRSRLGGQRSACGRSPRCGRIGCRRPPGPGTGTGLTVSHWHGRPRAPFAARTQAVLAGALPDAPWRAALGIAEPSRPLSRAIDSMQTPVRSAIAAADEPTLSGVLLAAVARGPGEHELDALARRVLQSALEQRQVRLTRTPGGVATDEPDPVSTSRRHPA